MRSRRASREDGSGTTSRCSAGSADKPARRRASALRSPTLRDDARVDHIARAGDRAEIEAVAGDLDRQEHEIRVEPLVRQDGAPIDVAAPELAAGAGDEMDDALLRLDPFVEML